MNTSAAKTAKITANLSWTALKFKFETLTELEQAIANGTINRMIEDCAERMYEGDTKPVVLALRRNLSSQSTNMKKADYIKPDNRDDAKRYQILWDFTGTLADDIKVSTVMPEGVTSTARWQLTREEIEALPRDWKIVDSIYQNMASKKAKAPDKIEETIGMDEFLVRFKMVAAIRSELRAQAKDTEKSEKIEASKAILTKLEGNKGRLTKKDIEALKELLK